MKTFFEFFAGGGMVRAGLSSGWSCRFANDFDAKKSEAYCDNWGDGEMVVDDIRNLSPDDMDGVPDLAWGSFPCQDLSLAGGGDTLAAIDLFDVANGVSYISTGGGAFLEYVEGKELPAVAALRARADHAS